MSASISGYDNIIHLISVAPRIQKTKISKDNNKNEQKKEEEIDSDHEESLGSRGRPNVQSGLAKAERSAVFEGFGPGFGPATFGDAAEPSAEPYKRLFFRKMYVQHIL